MVLVGPIYTYWSKTDGVKGVLGMPISNINKGHAFTWQNFQNGVVYSSEATGAHAILGNPSNANSFWGAFAAADYDRGLGLLTENRVDLMGGMSYQSFQKGQAGTCRHLLGQRAPGSAADGVGGPSRGIVVTGGRVGNR